jgi:hypothetical protein
MSEERRIDAVKKWTASREKELSDIEQRLGPVQLADLAEAHTRCINEPLPIGAASQRTALATDRPDTRVPPAPIPAGSAQAGAAGARTIARDIEVVDEWRQRLVPPKGGESSGRSVWTIDERYTPKLCSEATPGENREGFCIESPGLSEQILIMTDIQNGKENPRARAFALFIALVLPLLVILNKLLASEELHRSLARSVEWAGGGSMASKETLMATIVASGSTLEQRKQALFRLYSLKLLTPDDARIVHAIAIPELSAQLTRLLGREMSP